MATLADFGWAHGDNEQCIGCGENVLILSVTQLCEGEVMCSKCRRVHTRETRKERRAKIAEVEAAPVPSIEETCSHDWTVSPNGTRFCRHCLALG